MNQLDLGENDQSWAVGDGCEWSIVLVTVKDPRKLCEAVQVPLRKAGSSGQARLMTGSWRRKEEKEQFEKRY